MAEKKSFAGNKMSLRSGPGEQIHRISWLANNMHGLGDVLVSTQMSALAALGIGAVPLIILVFVFLMSNGAKNIGHLWLPVILVITGAVLLALPVKLRVDSRLRAFNGTYDGQRRGPAGN